MTRTAVRFSSFVFQFTSIFRSLPLQKEKKKILLAAFISAFHKENGVLTSLQTLKFTHISKSVLRSWFKCHFCFGKCSLCHFIALPKYGIFTFGMFSIFERKIPKYCPSHSPVSSDVSAKIYFLSRIKTRSWQTPTKPEMERESENDELKDKTYLKVNAKAKQALRPSHHPSVPVYEND